MSFSFCLNAISSSEFAVFRVCWINTAWRFRSFWARLTRLTELSGGDCWNMLKLQSAKIRVIFKPKQCQMPKPLKCSLYIYYIIQWIIAYLLCKCICICMYIINYIYFYCKSFSLWWNATLYPNSKANHQHSTSSRLIRGALMTLSVA